MEKIRRRKKVEFLARRNTQAGTVTRGRLIVFEYMIGDRSVQPDKEKEIHGSHKDSSLQINFAVDRFLLHTWMPNRKRDSVLTAWFLISYIY